MIPIAVLIQSENPSDSSHTRFICKNTVAVKATQAQVDAMARVECEESFPASELINPQDLMD